MSELVIPIQLVQEVMAGKGCHMTHGDVLQNLFPEDKNDLLEDPDLRIAFAEAVGRRSWCGEADLMRNYWKSAVANDVGPYGRGIPLEELVAAQMEARAVTSMHETQVNGPTLGFNLHRDPETPSVKSLHQLEPGT
jgi:hypothetical protein